MFKTFLAVIFTVCISSAANVWVSTESKCDIDTVYTTKYGAPVELAGASNFCVITKANDVNGVGFKLDSIKLFTGYRTFYLTCDKQGNKDTVFSATVWLDTASLITPVATNMDTSSVSDFAIYKSPVVTPTVNQYFQPIVKPAAGTRILKSIGWVVLDVQRQIGSVVVDQK